MAPPVLQADTTLTSKLRQSRVLAVSLGDTSHIRGSLIAMEPHAHLAFTGQRLKRQNSVRTPDAWLVASTGYAWGQVCAPRAAVTRKEDALSACRGARWSKTGAFRALRVALL